MGVILVHRVRPVMDNSVNPTHVGVILSVLGWLPTMPDVNPTHVGVILSDLGLS